MSYDYILGKGNREEQAEDIVLGALTAELSRRRKPGVGFEPTTTRLIGDERLQITFPKSERGRTGEPHFFSVLPLHHRSVKWTSQDSNLDHSFHIR